MARCVRAAQRSARPKAEREAIRNALEKLPFDADRPKVGRWIHTLSANLAFNPKGTYR
jgi:hypothetical protein